MTSPPPRTCTRREVRHWEKSVGFAETLGSLTRAFYLLYIIYIYCIYIYNQRIRPHLDHGMAACPPRTSAESKLLEGVQSRATAMVHGMKHLKSEERKRSLGLMKLNERRERILCWIRQDTERTHQNKSHAVLGGEGCKEWSKIGVGAGSSGRRQRQSFFSYRVVQKWNLLPTEVKTVP